VWLVGGMAIGVVVLLFANPLLHVGAGEASNGLSGARGLGLADAEQVRDIEIE
jgi:hypothetical protein